jgi:hypothetical protein
MYTKEVNDIGELPLRAAFASEARCVQRRGSGEESVKNQ